MPFFVILLLLSGSMLDHQVSAEPAEPCNENTLIKDATTLAVSKVPFVGDVFGLILNHIWPNTCDPRAYARRIVRDAIDKSEEEWLMRQFKGFKLVLEGKRGTIDADEDALEEFYDDISLSHAHFVRTDHPTTFIYFRDYATMKLTILASLRKLDYGKWNRKYMNEAKRLAQAAWDVIVKVPKVNPSSDCESTLPGAQKEKDWCIGAKRQEIKDQLWNLMNGWRQIANLPRKHLKEVKDWDWIQLRMYTSPGQSHRWLSCHISGSYCRGRTCPGKNGRTFGRCRGERFSIVNNKGGTIKACDRVGIRYSWWEDKKKGYWLSSYYKPDIYTMTCPKKGFWSLNRNRRCISEQWIIYAAGKDCGKSIEHSDIISLESMEYGNRFLTSTATSALFSPTPVFKGWLRLPGMSVRRRSFIIFKNGYYNSEYNW